jgi:hypothetical protein
MQQIRIAILNLPTFEFWAFLKTSVFVDLFQLFTQKLLQFSISYTARQHKPEDSWTGCKPYAHFQQCYDRMWTDYNRHHKNCKDWSREFWGYMKQ